MDAAGYAERRDWVGRHFRSSAERWERITSDAPVGRIRTAVRAGRRRMREHFLQMLPGDLTGHRVLDAGCGPGDLAIALATRGADVVGVDLSPELVAIARRRTAEARVPGRLEFRAGDMLDPGLGDFDTVVAMDSLIHYAPEQAVGAVAAWSERTADRVLFTIAPRTALLATLHAVGGLFPRTHRSPSIHPVGARWLRGRIRSRPELAHWSLGRDRQVKAAFYVSRLVELRRGGPDETPERS